MVEETILLEIPTGQIDAAIAAIAKARGEVAGLREAQKELKSEGQEGSAQFAKNNIRIKELSGTIRENERVVMANTKAQQANEGSIEQLRAQLTQTTSTWNKLSKEERENTEEGKKLSKQKLDLTNRLKELEKATGDTRRNVGNYSEGVKEALRETGLFSREQQALATVQKVVTATTKGTTAATKAFRVALISTGIGAIVVALGTLVTYLTQTQKGMDIVKQATAGLRAVFQVLIDRVLKFGSGIVKLFKGEFSAAVSDLKSAFSGLGEEIANEAKAAADLEKQIIALDKAQARLEVTRAKSRATIKELNQIAEDTTKSDAERIQAAQKAIQIENDLLNQQINIRKERLEIVKQQNDLGTSKEADKQKEFDLEIEIANLTQESLELQTTLQNKLNTITNQADANREAAAKDRKRSAEEQAKDEEEKQQKELKMAQERLNNELEAAKRLAQEELNVLSEKFLAGEISQAEYNAKIEEMELASLEARKEILERFGQDTMQIESEILQFKIANIKTETDVSAMAEATKLDQAKNTIDALASTMNQQTSVGKALAAAQTAISTYQAATAALEPPPVGLGPVLGPVLATLTTINGLAQVAKINSTQLPKFATGVIGVDGPGTGTSDSISAKISAGESVVTAKATAQFAPVIAAMERAVGNNPNIGKIGRAKFANGVINMGVNATRQAAQIDSLRERRQAEELSKQPIYVSVVELEDAQGRYNRARKVAAVEA